MSIKKIFSLGLIVSILLGSSILGVYASGTLGEAAQNGIGIEVAKEMHVSSNLVTYNIQVPKVQGLKDTAYQEQLNDTILNKALKDIEFVETQAKELAITAEKEGWEYRQHEIYIDYALKSKGDILSFIVNTYMYTGGANGLTRVDTYNINTVKNSGVELKDLFADGADYIGVINKEIMAQMEDREKSEGEMFFKGEYGFKTISEKQDFYIQDENLVIVFQKYDIAPGAMGTPEFKIPLSALKSILTDYNFKGVPVGLEIVVNGEKIEAPKAYNNEQKIVMVPVRAICEALGFEVNWLNETKKVTVGKDISLSAVMDSYSNAEGVEVKLGIAPEAKDGRVFVPMDFFTELIGLNDVYVSDSQIIINNNDKMGKGDR